MKLAVVILTILGVLAAGSAALVVRAMKISREIPTAQVLVLQSDSPAGTCLAAEHVAREPVPMPALPRGCLIDPTQVIGRYLSAPLKKGQVLTESSLAVRGSLTEKMFMLPPGMTVATVTVPARSISGGLLHPGCYVQVFATLRDSVSSAAKSTSGTLFKAIQVWSVGDEPEEPAPAAQGWAKVNSQPSSGAGTTGMVKVNLLATNEQAAILQMVSEQGMITLTIRSPREEIEQSDPHMPLVVDAHLRRALGLMPEEPPSEPAETVIAYVKPEGANEAAPAPSPKASWIVKVIRGAQVGVEEFPLKNEENGRNQ